MPKKKKKVSEKKLQYHRKIRLFGKAIVVIGIFAIFTLLILGLGTIKNILVPVPAQLVNQTIKDDNKDLNYQITVTYPQILGVGNTRKQADINVKIKAIIENSITTFKNELAQMPSDIPGDFPSTLLVQDTVERSDGKVLSILFTIEDFPRGAAHPTNYTQTFTYDMKTGKQLMLTDIFQPDADFLHELSIYCAEDLRKQFAKDNTNFDEFIAEGTKPVENNFKKFVLTSSGVVIVFDPGIVAPYAAGIRQVVIPYSAMSKIINTKYFN